MVFEKQSPVKINHGGTEMNIKSKLSANIYPTCMLKGQLHPYELTTEYFFKKSYSIHYLFPSEHFLMF